MLDPKTKPGEIVQAMRKRKGVKEVIPGVENVGRPSSNKCLQDALLTALSSTMTSYKDFLSPLIDFFMQLRIVSRRA